MSIYKYIKLFSMDAQIETHIKPKQMIKKFVNISVSLFLCIRYATIERNNVQRRKKLSSEIELFNEKRKTDK